LLGVGESLRSVREERELPRVIAHPTTIVPVEHLEARATVFRDPLGSAAAAVPAQSDLALNSLALSTLGRENVAPKHFPAEVLNCTTTGGNGWSGGNAAFPLALT
jgi:hypothetical protein